MQKCSFFSWWRSFQEKLLYFKQQDQRRMHLPLWLDQENLHFCMLFFENEKKKTAEKITGHCFPVKSKVIHKHLAQLETKKMA